MTYAEIITTAYAAQAQAYRFYNAADVAEGLNQSLFASTFEGYGDKAAKRAAFYFGLAHKYGCK